MKKIILSLLVSISLLVLNGCKDKEPTLNTDLSDNLKLESNYEGLDFLKDGIGQVTLTECVDGDTAIFNSNGEIIRVRFLGIDTPESTYKVDPWGKPASKYTCEKLTNATEIILESDEGKAVLDSTGARYLGWVWYDSRLLNLELVELAYSKSKSASSVKYGDLLLDANHNAQLTKSKIWGEQDPTYDYSLEGIQVTIEELRKNHSYYKDKKIAVEGLVTSYFNKGAYIESDGYGFYAYYGYSNASELAIGTRVLIDGTLGYFNGTPQIIDVHNFTIEELEYGIEVVPTIFTVEELDYNTNPYLEGLFVKVENLTYVSHYDTADSNGFTITFKDQSNNQINVRVDNSAIIDDENGDRITSGEYFDGLTIDVTGPVGVYNDEFQIYLTKSNDFQISE